MICIKCSGSKLFYVFHVYIGAKTLKFHENCQCTILLTHPVIPRSRCFFPTSPSRPFTKKKDANQPASSSQEQNNQVKNMKRRPHEKDNGGTQLKTPYLDFLLPSIEKRKGKYLFRDRRCLCRPHEVFIRTEKEDLGKTLLAVNKSQCCNTKYNMQLIYRSKPRLCEIKFGSCNLIHISP